MLSGQVDGAKRDDDKSGGGASASASISINGERSGVRAGGGSADDDKAGSTSFDDYAARVRRKDEANNSAVRTGTGGALGFYVAVRGFANKFQGNTFGYNVGVSPRYAFTSNLSLVGELGFAAFGTRAREALGGIALWVGAELRVKLNPYGSNAILLGAGPGYERYAAIDRASSVAYNTAHLRGRLGFGTCSGRTSGSTSPESVGGVLRRR